MKFAEYIVEWKKRARLNVSDGWRLCQDQILNDHIVPILGHIRLTKITAADVSDVMSASIKKGHSPNQRKKIYMVMSKVFSDAIHFFEYLDRSPAKKRFHLPKIPDIERPYLEYWQSVVLLEYSMHHALFGSAVWIQLLSGLRVSEVQALMWTDFDWVRKRINVTRAYNKLTKEIQNHTKNKLHYSVPISPKLETYLRPKCKRTGFVCERQTGGMMSENGYRIYLNRTLKKLKFPITSSHGLRHSCARIYKSIGATDDMIQALLGHKVMASTMTYLHKDNAELFELAKKLA